MSDVIPSEFEANNEDSSDGSSGNILDEECKESVADEGHLEVVSQEYGDINQTIVNGAEVQFTKEMRVRKQNILNSNLQHQRHRSNTFISNQNYPSIKKLFQNLHSPLCSPRNP